METFEETKKHMSLQLSFIQKLTEEKYFCNIYFIINIGCIQKLQMEAERTAQTD